MNEEKVMKDVENVGNFEGKTPTSYLTKKKMLYVALIVIILIILGAQVSSKGSGSRKSLNLTKIRKVFISKGPGRTKKVYSVNVDGSEVEYHPELKDYELKGFKYSSKTGKGCFWHSNAAYVTDFSTMKTGKVLNGCVGEGCYFIFSPDCDVVMTKGSEEGNFYKIKDISSDRVYEFKPEYPITFPKLTNNKQLFFLEHDSLNGGNVFYRVDITDPSEPIDVATYKDYSPGDYLMSEDGKIIIYYHRVFMILNTETGEAEPLTDYVKITHGSFLSADGRKFCMSAENLENVLDFYDIKSPKSVKRVNLEGIEDDHLGFSINSVSTDLKYVYLINENTAEDTFGVYSIGTDKFTLIKTPYTRKEFPLQRGLKYSERIFFARINLRKNVDGIRTFFSRYSLLSMLPDGIDFKVEREYENVPINRFKFYGKKLVGATNYERENFYRVIDLGTLTIKHVPHQPFNLPKEDLDIQLGPDCISAAITTFFRVSFTDLETGKCTIYEIDHKNRERYIGLVNDKKFIACTVTKNAEGSNIVNFRIADINNINSSSKKTASFPSPTQRDSIQPRIGLFANEKIVLMADFSPEIGHYNDNTMIFNLETKKALPLPFDNIKIIGISPSGTKVVYIQFAIFYQIFVYDTRTNKIDLISATKLVKNLDFLAWSVDESYLHMIDLESYELVMLSMKNNRLDYREMF